MNPHTTFSFYAAPHFHHARMKMHYPPGARAQCWAYGFTNLDASYHNYGLGPLHRYGERTHRHSSRKPNAETDFDGSDVERWIPDAIIDWWPPESRTHALVHLVGSVVILTAMALYCVLLGGAGYISRVFETYAVTATPVSLPLLAANFWLWLDPELLSLHFFSYVIFMKYKLW